MGFHIAAVVKNLPEAAKRSQVFESGGCPGSLMTSLGPVEAMSDAQCAMHQWGDNGDLPRLNGAIVVVRGKARAHPLSDLRDELAIA